MTSEPTHLVATSPAARVLGLAGWLAIVAGLIGVTFGSLWAEAALEFFESHAAISRLELFVPFLPVFSIAGGAWLVIRSRA